MDSKEILDNDYVSDIGLMLNAGNRAHLITTARWGKFLGIVGFVLTGFIVIAALGMGTFMSVLSDIGLLGSGVAFVYFILAVLYFFPSLYLYQYAVSLKRSLENEEQTELDKAFQNLNRLFLFVGILTAIVVIIYGLMIVIGLFAVGTSF